MSSVIRQKGESQNGCFKKARHAKISEKYVPPYYRQCDVNYISLKKSFFFSEFFLSFINFQKNFELKKKADLIAILSPDFMLTKSQY